MGRVPTKNKNLPTGMRARHRGKVTYYFLDTGEKPRRELALGKDYVEAVRKWGQLTASSVPSVSRPTFRMVAQRYICEVMHKKGKETQRKNMNELANLRKFFDDPREPMESIRPVMVRQYLQWRTAGIVEEVKLKNAARAAEGLPVKEMTGKEGQVAANRDKALLSHIWNFARGAGLTNLANPCAGIMGYKEDGRDVYVDDEIFEAVYAAAGPGLRDALDLAYLTGQRPADALKLTRAHVKDGALEISQNKTKKKLRIEIIGELATVMARIDQRPAMGVALINNEQGQKMTPYMLRYAFESARASAAAAHPKIEAAIRNFQFRDLRAKAGTDIEQERGIEAAQAQLGHSTSTMTAHYVRHRRGKLVKPTK
ncbi:tyrosine-type recombinase/integrase [Janthinobacterium sp. MDT1-19]